MRFKVEINLKCEDSQNLQVGSSFVAISQMKCIADVALHFYSFVSINCLAPFKNQESPATARCSVVG